MRDGKAPVADLYSGVSIFAGRAADRNERAMQGAVALGSEIGRRFGLQTQIVVAPEEIVPGGWTVQLQAARSGLSILAAHVDDLLTNRGRSLLVTTRCAASLATLPVVARRHPDAVVFWFDAHGDSNTPSVSDDIDGAYLGGMVLTGASGAWDTALGGDLDLSRVVLVGARDLDPPERELIAAGRLKLIEAGADLAGRLCAAASDLPVYVHLDCDVLTAGLLPTEYQVKGGLDFEALHEAAEMLARQHIIGLEIAEFEGTWPDGRPGDLECLLDAMAPLIKIFC